ncbi:MAG: hypothetical protein LBC85_10840 [Fibromonadaceae bacterium]|jgi:hypothetical protein|nr:hypothetical protein [Fibromonadaceae bacterium]
METLLVFAAIIAIQIIAARSKQKKEAAKRAAQAQKPVPVPSEPMYEELPSEEPETIPDFDPFKEIREAMGLPPAEAPPEPEPVKAEVFQPQPELPPRLELLRDTPFLRQPLGRGAEAKSSIPHPIPHTTHSTPQLHSNVAQGIIWASILQEPRFRAKWRPKCSR